LPQFASFLYHAFVLALENYHVKKTHNRIADNSLSRSFGYGAAESAGHTEAGAEMDRLAN